MESSNPLAAIISQLRKEVGLEPFKLREIVLCRLYKSDDVQFICTIYGISASSFSSSPIYLVDCPPAYGFEFKMLTIKTKNITNVDEALVYRWVEEETLELY